MKADGGMSFEYQGGLSVDSEEQEDQIRGTGVAGGRREYNAVLEHLEIPAALPS